MPTYKQLTRRNPEYRADTWAKIRALYDVVAIVEKRDILKKLMPRGYGETDDNYNERLERAFYIPYLPGIIDWIVSALMTSAVAMKSQPQADRFYDEFAENTASDDAEKVPLQEYVRNLVLTALLLRRAWTLVDFPERLPGMEFKSRADEDSAGVRRAYLCSVDPENVLDWERDRKGQLTWVCILSETQPRETIESSRDEIRQEFTVYTQDKWTRYAIQFKADKQPKPDDPVPEIASGAHSFGCVPVIPFELPRGLWAAGKIMSIAIAHLNQRNALSWEQLRSLFQFLLWKMQPAGNAAGADDPVAEDTSRPVSQTFGPGRVIQAAENDTVEYVGPDAGPFEFALQDLNALRDEMHRVVSAMAQSVDNSGAALKRSAESKQIDQNAMTVVLEHLGDRVRKFLIRLFQIIATGRGDSPVEWTAEGMDDYGDISASAFVDEAVALEGIEMPPEFWIIYKFALARKLVGNFATPDELKKIRAQLESMTTAESVMRERLPKNQTPPGATDPESPDDGEGAAGGQSNAG